MGFASGFWQHDQGYTQFYHSFSTGRVYLPKKHFEVLDAYFDFSPQLFSDYILMTMLIPAAESKSSMAQRH